MTLVLYCYDRCDRGWGRKNHASSYIFQVVLFHSRDPPGKNHRTATRTANNKL